MQDEATDVVRVGVELIVAAIFLFLAVSLALVGYRWYNKEEYHKYQTQYMTQTAPTWTFESAAEKGKTVSGDDIVNFIVKNDTRYEYVIGTGKFKTSDKKDISKIWNDTEKAVKDNTFYEFSSHDLLTKKDPLSGGDINTVRVYDRDRVDRILEENRNKDTKGMSAYYIYSEPYLLYTAGMYDHLNDRFRVYTYKLNGDIIRYYFLLDPDEKSAEQEVR